MQIKLYRYCCVLFKYHVQNMLHLQANRHYIYSSQVHPPPLSLLSFSLSFPFLSKSLPAITSFPLLSLLLQQCMQIRSSLQLFSTGSLSNLTLVSLVTCWSLGQHLAAMFAEISRHIFGQDLSKQFADWSACCPSLSVSLPSLPSSHPLLLFLANKSNV